VVNKRKIFSSIRNSRITKSAVKVGGKAKAGTLKAVRYVSGTKKRLAVAFAVALLPVGLVGYAIGYQQSTKVASSKNISSKSVTKPNSKDTSGTKSQTDNSTTSRIDRAKDRIAKAVEKKQLTKEQADSLNKKIDELKSFSSLIENKSPEEHSKAISEKRKELSQWAKDNKISPMYISTVLF